MRDAMNPLSPRLPLLIHRTRTFRRRTRRHSDARDATPPRPANIALAQLAIPDYRQEVLDAIYARCGDTFEIYLGEALFEATVKSDVSYQGPQSHVANVFLLRRRLAW